MKPFVNKCMALFNVSWYLILAFYYVWPLGIPAYYVGDLITAIDFEKDEV